MKKTLLFLTLLFQTNLIITNTTPTNENISNEPEENLCLICVRRPILEQKETFECGTIHNACCAECTDILVKEKKNCPLCRAPIKKISSHPNKKKYLEYEADFYSMRTFLSSNSKFWKHYRKEYNR